MQKSLIAAALMATSLMLQGCLAAAAAGTAVGVAGAAVGVTAKGVGAVGRAVIPGDSRKDERERRRDDRR